MKSQKQTLNVMKKNMKVKITSEIPSPLQTIPNSCGGNEEYEI